VNGCASRAGVAITYTGGDRDAVDLAPSRGCRHTPLLLQVNPGIDPGGVEVTMAQENCIFWYRCRECIDVMKPEEKTRNRVAPRSGFGGREIRWRVTTEGSA
jgi:hypothetical protein